MSILKIEEDDICKAALRRYVTFQETITDKTASLSAKYYEDDARYQAPLRDIAGRREIAGFWLNHRTIYTAYKFKTQQIFWSEDGQTAFVRWDFLGTKQGKSISVSGMSEITFSLKGLIISHIDYYDPLRAFLYDVPVLGGILKSRLRTR